MKKVILFLHFMFLLILLVNSQNAVIKNNYVIAYRGDTIVVNMNNNNFDPDEGEVLKIKKFKCLNPRDFKYISNTDSTLIFVANYYYSGNFTVISTINETRNNFILASYQDTLFIKYNDTYWYDSLKINNINATFSASGLLFEKFCSPIFSNNICNLGTSLLISGYNQNNNLKASKTRYGLLENDYNFGPIARNFKSKNYLKKYSRIWKTSFQKIEYHQNNWFKNNYIIDNDILNWPANGDTTNGEPFQIAPFQDLNNNNIYEPLLGEYPLIKGDECVYMIFNDSSSLKSNLGKTIGVEVKTMIYGFNKSNNQPINNCIFAEIEIINKSVNSFDSLHLGLFYNYTIGNIFDDLVGCDTNLNLIFSYNATNYDYFYNNYPSACGILLLNNKLDSFVDQLLSNYYALNDIACYNFLKGKFSDGKNIYYGGNGIYGNPSVTNNVTKYHYDGDPNDTLQWSQYSAKTNGSNQSYISTPPRNFAPNEKIKFDIAFIFAQDSNLNNLQNVNLLKQYAQTVKDFHKVIVKEEIKKFENIIKIYPNPVNDKFYVDFGIDNENFNVYIYDINGKLILSKKAIQNYSFFDVNSLKQGIYFVIFSNNKKTFTTKLIKN